jgi:LacI family transcriptional regulator
MRVDQALVAQGDFTRESGRQQAAKLFAARPTAIFSSNDEMALGIIDAAAKAGIAVPGSISLVGFDDNPGAKFCRPALTTVRQPLEQMGATACRMLVELIRNPGKQRQTVTEPYEVIERNSVADWREEQAA